MAPAPDEGLGDDLWQEEGPTWDLGAAENTPFLDAAKASLAKGNPEGAELADEVAAQLRARSDELSHDPARAKALMLSDDEVERMRELGELAEQFSADNRVSLLDQPKEGTALGDFTHETGLITVYRDGDERNTLVHELSHASRVGSEDSDRKVALYPLVEEKGDTLSTAEKKPATPDEVADNLDYHLLLGRDEFLAHRDGDMAEHALGPYAERPAGRDAVDWAAWNMELGPSEQTKAETPADARVSQYSEGEIILDPEEFVFIPRELTETPQMPETVGDWTLPKAATSAIAAQSAWMVAQNEIRFAREPDFEDVVLPRYIAAAQRYVHEGGAFPDARTFLFQSEE